LHIKLLTQPEEHIEIFVSSKDELIDLSPCIGIYQEAVFFSNYNIDKSIELWLDLHKDQKFLYSSENRNFPLDNKILILVSLETKQNRYRVQVNTPYVNNYEREQIVSRLSTLLSPDENVQVPCVIDFSDKEGGKILFSAQGFADVVKDNMVYELKFVSELTHDHFLQCATYIIALGLEKGVLWNTRNNTRYEIQVSDKDKYLDAITKAVTKGYLQKYCIPKEESQWRALQSSIQKQIGTTK
jgi:hypothetical protein